MIISVYGIARPEEQASLVAGGGSGKCRDPLWRIGHYFSRVKAHAITTPIRVAHRLPTSNEHRILPNPLQELSQDLHATHFKEGTRNQHIRRICVLVCAELETSRRYLFRPSLTQTSTGPFRHFFAPKKRDKNGLNW